MPFALTRRVYEVGAVVVAIALMVVMGDRLLGATGLALENGNPVFGDFIAFWAAGRVVLSGHPELVHNVVTIQHVQWDAVPGMRWVAGWNSPPQFLLIAVFLALFPYPVAALIWLGAGIALYVAAAWVLLPDKRALLFALTLPAAVYHLGSVQTGLWIAGVSGLALYYLDTKPIRAGALISLLAIKPHLAIIWPIYLAITGRWRTFFTAAASLALFTLAAILAFGWESIPRFINNLSATQNLIDAHLVSTATFGSLYGNLLTLGAPHAVAMTLQMMSAVAALGVGLLVFKRGDARAQGAAFCALTMLASPYLFFYDMTLLAVGAAMMGAPRTRFEAVALVFAWGAGLSLATSQVLALPLCAFASWLVLISAARRIESAGVRLAPAPRT